MITLFANSAHDILTFIAGDIPGLDPGTKSAGKATA